MYVLWFHIEIGRTSTVGVSCGRGVDSTKYYILSHAVRKRRIALRSGNIDPNTKLDYASARCTEQSGVCILQHSIHANARKIADYILARIIMAQAASALSAI